MGVSWILIAAGVVLGFLLLSSTPDPVGAIEDVSVSVIVPARNEEAALPDLLASLDRQTIPLAQVIVVDDSSQDATAAVARAAGASVLSAPPLPPGWVGKPWACHLGAASASSDVLVFLDADVTIAPDGLERILATWRRDVPDGLLSVQPHHRTVSAYEQLSAYPNLVAMMSTGAFTPARHHTGAGAFGPCLVTAAAAYRAVGGHESVASEVIEDMHLAQQFRAAGRGVRIAAGGTAVSFRMYPLGLGQLIDGWTKNLAGGPRLVGLLPLVGTVWWLMASIAVATDAAASAVSLLNGGSFAVAPAVAYAVVAAQLALLLRRIGRFAWWTPILYPLPLAGFVSLFAWSAVRRGLRRSVRWRGRTILVPPR